MNDAELQQEKHIREGKAALEIGWNVFNSGPKGWRKKIVLWLWPDLRRMANAIMEYYWAN